MTRQGLEPCCTPMHTGRCHEHTCMPPEARRLSVSTTASRSDTHAGRRRLAVARLALCFFGCQGSVRTGRAGGGAYETLLPLNRESRVCVTVQPAAVLPSYSLWVGLGRINRLVLLITMSDPSHCSGYQSFLSVGYWLITVG